MFGSEIEQVKIGCLAAEGIDYISLGKQTGKMAAQVLKGEKKASELNFETITTPGFYVNNKVAENLGITVPTDLSDNAVETFDEITPVSYTHLLDAIKSLVVSFNPNDTTFSLSVQDRELYVSNNLTQSLTDVFTTIGETALKTETPICFFIDEIQYMKQEQLGSLIAALHRTNQLGYPVMIIGCLLYTSRCV